MGHYYGDMFPHGEDKTFDFRYARYKQACAREISEIVKGNPIKFEEIEIGDGLTLYEPLKGLSKIRFDNKGEFHKIRELFSSRAKCYDWDFWSLVYCDNFTCYDKRIDICREREFPLIRISSPPQQVGKYNPVDWPVFQHWVSPKYFRKK